MDCYQNIKSEFGLFWKYHFLVNKSHVLSANTDLKTALASREGGIERRKDERDLLTCLESRSIAESIRFLCAQFCKKFLHNKPSAVMELFSSYSMFISTITLFIFSKPLSYLQIFSNGNKIIVSCKWTETEYIKRF